MSLVLVIVSVAIRVAALWWSLLLLNRVGDRRILLLSAVLALMALRQALTAVVEWGHWSGAPADALAELPGLGVSVGMLLVVVLIGRMLEDYQAAVGVADQNAEALRASERRMRWVLDQAPLVLWAYDDKGVFTFSQGRGLESLGQKPGEVVGRSVFDVYADNGRVLEDARRALSGEPVRSTVTVGELVFEGRQTPVRDEAGRVVGVIGVAIDVTERNRAERELAQRADRLAALHQIDKAINASLDLHDTLEVFLDQMLVQEGVDAADVLLLEDDDCLVCAAHRGFKADIMRSARLCPGQGLPVGAVRDRRIVQTADLAAATDDPRAAAMRTEGLSTYTAVPLEVRGELRGVLEVFHRSATPPDPEWVVFLETVAAEASIAIGNAALFAELQSSHRALTEAYDATLEGWVRALDLRDRETEGHTQRVTRMTVQLARRLGVPEEDLAQVRRGALLHDIGKIGIPDSILRKPGPLTAGEWELMQQHPVLAYELLSAIPFLRPSLDIPYCHHERWDGTGYPRGLKGEEIPLAARIFSVVDVWDALLSDRHYRAAWSASDVLEHVRREAGGQFDPAVVEAFLALLAETPPPEEP